tara:strand:+ start:810199 stop:810660 length:462 start_codon:yes stop_codon:yes gene_type:complete
MNSGSAIIGAVIIALCIFPFILMRRNSKKKQKQLLQELTNYANQYQCQVNKYEFFSDFVIGLDETKNVAFFHKKSNEEIQDQHVNLGDIKECKIINNRNDGTIDSLKLSFIPIAKNATEILFEFFNIDVNIQPTGELQLIDKWSKNFNNLLKK